MRTVVPMTARPPHARPAVVARPRALAIVAGLLVLAGLAPVGTVGAAGPGRTPTGGAGDPAAALQPTVQYEEAVAHANDTTRFAPGDRVTVPFTPREADRWTVGGVRRGPCPPAGSRARRCARRARHPAARAARRRPAPVSPAPRSGRPTCRTSDPAAAIAGTPAAAVDPGGLKREVFGFLPYWELTDRSTRLDWEKLSTVAYFGVGASANGDLQKRNSDGSTTVGWSGWTSSKMTGRHRMRRTGAARGSS